MHWMREGFYWKGGPVIADVDADGEIEIVAVNDDKYAEAINGKTGATEWVSNAYLSNTYPQNLLLKSNAPAFEVFCWRLSPSR